MRTAREVVANILGLHSWRLTLCGLTKLYQPFLNLVRAPTDVLPMTFP